MRAPNDGRSDSLHPLTSQPHARAVQGVAGSCDRSGISGARRLDSVTDAGWFVPLADDTTGEAQVVAIPQAGGGCATFAPMADRLAPHVTVWGANFPGRQARFLEPPCTDLEVVLDRLAADYPTRGRTSPVWILLRRAVGLPARPPAARPRRATAGGAGGRLVPGARRRPAAENTAQGGPGQFWSEVLALGGVPAPVAEQPDFREIFEVGLRADYALLADYVFAEEPALPIPIIAVHGTDDPMLRGDPVDRWSRHTAETFHSVRTPGDHWILDNALDGLVDVLRRAAIGPPAPVKAR
jgi:surfactin synthase thioesterase subunit